MTTTELRGPRYAELTTLFLQSRGIANARTRPRGRFSELVLNDDFSTGDIQDLGPFYVATRASYSMTHLSDSLDRAEDQAHAEGKPYPVVVWFRRERSIAQHYGILPLWALAEIVAEFEKREVA
jgi:hypothetical protein